jgi:hypothetical protein
MFIDARRYGPETYVPPAGPVDVQAAVVEYPPRPERYDVIAVPVWSIDLLANATMRNVSAEGCNLRVHGEHTLAAEQPIVIRIGLWCQFGIVRWTKGELVGIRFRHPLRPENLEGLRQGCPGICVQLHHTDR